MVGGQTALPPAYTIPPIDIFPVTTAGVLDFEAEWARRMLLAQRESDTAGMAPGVSRIPMIGGETALPPATSIPRLDMLPATPAGAGDFQEQWDRTALIDEWRRSRGEPTGSYEPGVLVDGLDWLAGALGDAAVDAPHVINGMARQFANNVPFIGGGINDLEARTWAWFNAPDGEFQRYYEEELARQNQTDEAFERDYPFFSSTGSIAGTVLGALAASELAPAGLALGVGGWAAPLIDRAATGALFAGLDNFAGGYFGADGSVSDRIGAGLEGMPVDMLWGAMLGPLAEDFVKKLGGAGEGAAGRAIGNTLEELFNPHDGVMSWLMADPEPPAPTD